MKKFIPLTLTLALISSMALAQDNTVNNPSPANSPAIDKVGSVDSNNSQKRREKREERRQERRGEQPQGRPDNSTNYSNNPANNNANTPAESAQPYSDKKSLWQERRNERFENAPNEQRARMEKHFEMMRNLSPEKKELVRKERQRHREEMKKITGFELPEPPMPVGRGNN